MSEVIQEPVGISRAISFKVLMQDPDIRKIVENGELVELEPYLTKLGIDVKLPYEVVTCEHRPYPSKPETWYGPRLQGYESLMPEWIKSGYASMDAIIFSDRDVSKRMLLSGLNREGASSAEVRHFNDKED